MKKILLFAAAALVAASASAATEKEVLKSFYTGEGSGTLGGWGATFDSAAEEDGKPCVKVTVESEQANDWSAQMAFDYDFEPGTTYYLDFEVKGTVEGSITSGLQNSTSYAGGGNFTPFKVTKEWAKQTIECTATAAGDGLPNRWTANFGKYVGSCYITNMTLYVLKEGEGGDDPEEPAKNVIAKMYPGDASLIAWGADGVLEAVKEDDKDCAKLTNSVEKNPWEVQFAYDAEGGYAIGQTYYIEFDVKGDASDGIGSGFQCTDGYIGCGDMNTFAITPEWKRVKISGTVTDPGDGKSVQRWVASIGKYIGTFYISNLEIYTLGESAVDAVVAAPVVREGVYNLQGVKVADSLDEVTLPGLYIANGKKYIKK